MFPVDRQRSLTTIFKAHKDHQQQRLRPETDPKEREKRQKAKFDIFNDVEDEKHEQTTHAWEDTLTGDRLVIKDPKEERQQTTKRPLPRKSLLPPITRHSLGGATDSLNSDVLNHRSTASRKKVRSSTVSDDNLITHLRRAQQDSIHHKN